MVLVSLVRGAMLAGHGRPVPADPGENLARAAETAFLAGRYDEAAQKYEELARESRGDAAVLYNLATAQARAGRKGLAIWRYLQALELTPRDRDIRNNLLALAPDAFDRLAIAPLPRSTGFIIDSPAMNGRPWGCGADGGDAGRDGGVLANAAPAQAAGILPLPRRAVVRGGPGGLSVCLHSRLV